MLNLVLCVAILMVPASRAIRPHIIVILPDDLGWDDVSFHGSSQIPTPNLDVLAATGVILNNYYVQPLCTPSRAALMTGMYPIHTGMQHYVLEVAEPRGLPLNHKIMPKYLRDLGYETHLVGKWHLGCYRKEYTPTFRGFDSFYGFYNADHDYYTQTMERDGSSGLDFWHNLEPLMGLSGNYSTDLFTKRAVSLIENRDPSKPLFLYLSHQAPHAGQEYNTLQAPRENIRKFRYIKQQNRTIFAAMVDALDKSVGTVLEALRDAQILNETIIVFSSDNGGLPWGGASNSGSNWPLRGTKFTLWEGGVRVPAFIWSPLLKTPGRVSQQLMHITDWLPTLYAAAGGDPTAVSHLDGKNMWDSLSRNLPSCRADVLINIDPILNVSALRYGNHKLMVGNFENGIYDQRFPTAGEPRPSQDIHYLMEQSSATRVLKTLELGLLNYPPDWRNKASTRCSGISADEHLSLGESPYLFDVHRDPCERVNLSAKKKEMLQWMMDKLRKYEAGQQIPGNMDIDEMAYPEHHQGIWARWKDFEHNEL